MHASKCTLWAAYLVGEGAPVNAAAASAVASSCITTLTHKVGNDAMEGGALVAKRVPLLTCT